MKRNFFVLFPSFEDYGGHEVAFLKPLKFFTKKNNFELFYFLPKINSIKLNNKSLKIFFGSKNNFFLIKIIYILFIDLNYKAALRRWRNTSRRLLLAARDTQTMVWLQTNKNEKRSRPIWSHVKIEIGATQKELCVEIKKHKEGSAPWQGTVAHPVYNNFLNCRRIFCHTPK